MRVLLLAPQPFYSERGTPISVENLIRVMSVEAARLIRKNMYDMVHGLEEAVFIAAALQNFTVRHTFMIWTPCHRNS